MHKARSTDAVDGASSSVSLFEILPREEIPVSSADDDRHQKAPSDFLFSAKVQSEMDADFQQCGNGVAYGEPSEITSGCGLSQSVGRGDLEMVQDVDEKVCKDRRGSPVRDISSARNGSSGVQDCDEGAKNKADEGMEDAGWMELEGGGEANAAF